MLTRRTLLAGGLGCLAPLPAWAQSRTETPDVVRIPIEVTASGLPIVGATIAGRRLRFILDTGAEVSAIRRGLAQPLGLKRVGRRPGVGADGRIIIADYEAHDVVLGDRLRLAGLPLSAIPGLTAYDGLLGAGFLTARPSELDYGRREIRIHAGSAMDLDGYSSLGPGRVHHGPRFYCPFALGGLVLSGMLDTGFETEVFLNAGIVARHGLWDRFAVRQEKTFTGIAGKRLVTRVVEMPDLRLGDIACRAVRVTLADPKGGGIPAIGPDDAVLGASLLKRFSIAFAGAGGLGFRVV